MARKITDTDVSLDDFNDVDLTGVSDGHALIYQDGSWISTAPSAGGEEVLPDQFKGTLGAGGIYLGRNKVAQQLLRFDSPGRVWALEGATINERQRAVSADGSFIAAVHSRFDFTDEKISISRDFGQTFTHQTIDGVKGWRQISCSSDGRVLLARASWSEAGWNGRVYLSVDGGVNWSLVGTEVFARRAGISADGSVIGYSGTFDGVGYCKISHDSGATWNSVAPLGSIEYYSIAFSSDAKYICLSSFSSPNYVLSFSSDYGSSWSSVFSTTGLLSDVGISSDGRHVLVSVSGVGLYVSHNYGASFELKSSLVDVDAQYVAVSADGRIMVSTVYNASQIKVSEDWGDTWDTVSHAYIPALPGGICMTSDGSVIYHNGESGGSYKAYSGVVYDGMIIQDSLSCVSIQDGDLGLGVGDLYFEVIGGNRAVCVKV